MKVALVGNPNCGKTTLFNRLTHGNQKIGNWPGVTIERKSGIIENTAIECVDLPGIYSLNSYTLEEQITQNYLFEEKPDLIINVIDVTLLDRSLYLTSQLFDLNCPLLLVFNMMDCLSKKGIQIDFEYLKKQLRVPIVFLSAISNQGIHTLIQQLKNGN